MGVMGAGVGQIRTMVGALSAAALLSACGGDGASGDESGGDGPEASAPTAGLPSLGTEASPEVRALYEGEFEAFGALSGLAEASGEGSWQLRLSNDFAQFIRPGLEDVPAYTVNRRYYAQGMRAQAGALTVTIVNAECPAPTGESLPYTASVLFEDFTYEGCARRGLAQPGEELTWAVDLEALTAAIDACLAAHPGERQVVTLASVLPPAPDGQVLVSVRLRDATRERRECFATPDGGRIISDELLSDADVRAGEGEAEFTRSPGPAPSGGRCRVVEDVAGGWLSRRTC